MNSERGEIGTGALTDLPDDFDQVQREFGEPGMRDRLGKAFVLFNSLGLYNLRN
jgi:hypothetical protein